MPTHAPPFARVTTVTPLACLVLLLSACGGSGGFSQAQTRELPPQAQPEVNHPDVQRALALRAQLPAPYRLGVYFRGAGDGDAAWRWEPEHRKAVMAMLGRVSQHQAVTEAFAIARATVAADDLRSIRVAAARHGADAVLVISGHDEVEDGLNAWATTYVALLPMLFVPAGELDVRFMAHAELWDVRNEYLYVAAEAESEAHQTRALPFIDRQEATRSAQDGSLERLGGELERRFAALHAAAP
jgi:hypothetical protein